MSLLLPLFLFALRTVINLNHLEPMHVNMALFLQSIHFPFQWTTPQSPLFAAPFSIPPFHPPFVLPLDGHYVFIQPRITRLSASAMMLEAPRWQRIGEASIQLFFLLIVIVTYCSTLVQQVTHVSSYVVFLFMQTSDDTLFEKVNSGSTTTSSSNEVDVFSIVNESKTNAIIPVAINNCSTK